MRGAAPGHGELTPPPPAHPPRASPSPHSEVLVSFVSGEKDEFLKREYQSTTGIAALQEVCQSLAASTKVVAVEGDRCGGHARVDRSAGATRTPQQCSTV